MIEDGSRNHPRMGVLDGTSGTLVDVPDLGLKIASVLSLNKKEGGIKSIAEKETKDIQKKG